MDLYSSVTSSDILKWAPHSETMLSAAYSFRLLIDGAYLWLFILNFVFARYRFRMRYGVSIPLFVLGG